MIEWAYVAGGAVVGFIVGLTGVGGGSLMTPLLLYGFGVSPSVAVGTDLLFAGLTKGVGVWSFARRGLVPWRVVRDLGGASVAGVAAMLLVLHTVGAASAGVQQAIRVALGVMLLLTAMATAIKVMQAGWRWRATPAPVLPPADDETAQAPRWRWAPWVFGAAIGALVALTSVGAGAVGVVALMAIYPRLPMARVVAADVTYAVPVTLIAGLGHAALLGTVDWALLGWLLLGSWPGIWLGSRLVQHAPVAWLRTALSAMLGWVGIKLLGVV